MFILKFAKRAILLLTALILSISFLLFLILSLPVYLFRLFATQLAKVFRPDIDEILNGQSNIFASDYFSEKPQRSIILVTAEFQGQFSCEQWKQIIMEKWINLDRNHPYKKFKQYPFKWLGFIFWKWADKKFNIDNHVHQLFGKEQLITDDKLDDTLETLLNSSLPTKQSPWEFYVVENYKSSISNDGESHSFVIYKQHHLLADGFSITTAFMEGLFGEKTLSKINLPIPKLPRRSFMQKLLYMVSLPLNILAEVSDFISNSFEGGRWKIPDGKKEWHQMLVRTDPIPIQVIKNIKNATGVGFTSVLLSAISAAVHKSISDTAKMNKDDKSVLFLSSMPNPSRSRNNKLTNKLTAAIFAIPAAMKFESPLHRVRKVDEVLEQTKMTSLPYMSELVSTLVGMQFYWISGVLLRNRVIPMGFTNFPGMPVNLELNGRLYSGTGLILGGQGGECGVAIGAISHNQHLRLAVAVESGLMSRKNLQKFLTDVTDEIRLLTDITK